MNQTCPVIVIHTPSGAFAGLLMSSNGILLDKAASIELMAISSGGINAKDMQAYMEWRIFATLMNTYKGRNSEKQIWYVTGRARDLGKTARLSDVEMAFAGESFAQEPLVRKVIQRIDELAEEEMRMEKPFLDHQWIEARNMFMRQR